MSIKLNYVYGSCQIFFVIFDQVKKILLEANFDYLGPEMTFFYWYLVFCVEDFCKHPKNNTYNVSFTYFTCSDEICI